MTPEAFRSWLEAMHASGRVRSDAEAGRLLGWVSPNSVQNAKQRGTDRRTDLACRALLDGLDPWQPPPMPERRR